VARFFLERKETLLLGSAAEIADLTGTSDATVVRTARTLGFEGLAELREAALADLTSTAPSPSGRLQRTLEQTGDDPVGALRHVTATHEKNLQELYDPEFERRFALAVKRLVAARRCHVFGIGPSGTVADYAALQFNRIGFPSSALSVSGIGLADRLLGLAKGDAILMIAYAPIYREVAVTLDHAERLEIPVVLVSDSLGPSIGERVEEVLSVPRGQAGNLALHGATVVVVEALVAAIAARRRDTALTALEGLSSLRGAIDKDWLKRGVTRRPPSKRTP
jgi:DNA-binding MurR/RpiR family transcriptional regulator